MSITLLALFMVFMAVGAPLAIALGVASIGSLVIFTDIPLSLIIQSMYSSMNSFIMVAVPLFILTGILMDEGGVAEKIFNFANALVGWSHGGLGNVTVVSSVIFAGMSGSSVADVASVGRISISAMSKNGYPLGYASALALITSMLATIIPPSILMVIAASVANISIGQALFAGVIPGLIVATVFMLYNYYYCRKNHVGTKVPFSFRNLGRQFVIAIPALMVPIILLGGMLSGWFTPTEAAAVSVLYTLFVAMFVYRNICFNQLPRIFFQTCKLTGTILFIAVTAKPAGWIFEFDGASGHGRNHDRGHHAVAAGDHADHLRVPDPGRHVHGRHRGHLHPGPHPAADGDRGAHRPGLLRRVPRDRPRARAGDAAGRRLPLCYGQRDWAVARSVDQGLHAVDDPDGDRAPDLHLFPRGRHGADRLVFLVGMRGQDMRMCSREVIR